MNTNEYSNRAITPKRFGLKGKGTTRPKLRGRERLLTLGVEGGGLYDNYEAKSRGGMTAWVPLLLIT